MSYGLGSALAKLGAQRGPANVIESCEFTGNYGGFAAATIDPYTYAINNVFHRNGEYPDGLYPEEIEPPALETVLFVEGPQFNSLSSLEADMVVGAQIYNSTIADNRADYGIGAMDFGSYAYNTIVWNGYEMGTLANVVPVACDLESPPDMMTTTVEPSEVASWFSEWPVFVDPDAGDYRLEPWSPCIDTGMDASGMVDDDFDGVMRPIDGDKDETAQYDIGAFEYDPWSDIRIGGEDRYETSVEISQRHFPNGADTVVLATGRKFADGLSSAGLAGVYNAPILLTDPNALPTVVADEIIRLGAGRVVIIGETKAVSADVADEVAGLGDIVVDRIGGVDRYETAALVADEIVAELGDGYSGMYFVARGDLYADALTASPVAWANQVPILLVEPGEMPEATVDVITAVGGGRAVIVGGTAAVGPAVEASARSLADTVERITGTDRYDTSAEFSMWAVDGAFASWSRVGVATGEKFPDALSGGPGIGVDNGVVLLTPKMSTSSSVMNVISDNAIAIDSIEVFGGEGAVSAAVYDAIMALLAP